jgi:transposase
MALELSNRSWKVCFGDGRRRRRLSVEAGDLDKLREQIEKAKKKLGLVQDCPVMSCYEAGRDGFWLHRYLLCQGVSNVVVDSSSIEVNRRQRRAKTDRLDVEALLRLLIRSVGGEERVWSVVRVPSRAAEEGQRLSRERDRLVKERGAHTSRMKSLLVTQGLRMELRGDFEGALERVRLWDGSGLSADLKAELIREWRRRQQVQEQIKALEAEQRARIEAAAEGPELLIRQLMELKSVGWQTAWLLVTEVFGWRRFANRRELTGCVGLSPSPYNSGDDKREQGISKAGNRRVRRLLIELAWLWLRYQPDSEITQWYKRRWAGQGKRARRVGIVAAARRLVIVLWRYLESGVVPPGVVLQASR